MEQQPQVSPQQHHLLRSHQLGSHHPCHQQSPARLQLADCVLVQGLAHAPPPPCASDAACRPWLPESVALAAVVLEDVFAGDEGNAAATYNLRRSMTHMNERDVLERHAMSLPTSLQTPKICAVNTLSVEGCAIQYCHHQAQVSLAL